MSEEVENYGQFEPHQIDTSLDEAHNEIHRLQERVAELESAQRWIPCSERLPEENTLVWVFTPDDGDGFSGGVDWIEEGVWSEHYSSYEHYQSIGGASACGLDVACTGPSEDAPYTHWLPLPAPPQEQDK